MTLEELQKMSPQEVYARWFEFLDCIEQLTSAELNTLQFKQADIKYEIETVYWQHKIEEEGFYLHKRGLI